MGPTRGFKFFDASGNIRQWLKSRRNCLFIGIGVVAIALLCMTGIVSTGERTASDYKNEIQQVIDEELAKSDSMLKKRIEDAHLTVKVTSTRIVRCDVSTLDGTERAGKDDSNIDKVSMLIRFNWNGVFDIGYTDLRFVYDAQNDRVLKSEIEYTTAMFNSEDPDFWWDVGFLIGTVMAM